MLELGTTVWYPHLTSMSPLSLPPYLLYHLLLPSCRFSAYFSCSFAIFSSLLQSWLFLYPSNLMRFQAQRSRSFRSFCTRALVYDSSFTFIGAPLFLSLAGFERKDIINVRTPEQQSTRTSPILSPYVYMLHVYLSTFLRIYIHIHSCV